MAGQVAPPIPVTPPAMLVRLNPSVPVSTNPVTGSAHLPVNQPAGTGVVAEVQAAGDLWLVPAGKTFTGFATLLVGGPSGSVTIEDGSSTVIHEVGPEGSPVVPYQVPFSSAGGGGGNQLSVVVSGAAVLLSASIAGYFK